MGARALWVRLRPQTAIRCAHQEAAAVSVAFQSARDGGRCQPHHRILDKIGHYGDEEEQCLQLRELLHERRVWIRDGQLQKTSKDLNAAFKKDISFNGSDAESLVGMIELLLEVVIPQVAREKDREVARLHANIMQLWTAWRRVWRLLNNDLDSTCAKARGARADAVQVEADAYVDAWVKVVGNTQGLYIHYMHAHVADMVREIGDLRPYQSQGLEHCHSLRKLIARQLTNRHQFGPRPVNVQSLSHIMMKHAVKVREGDSTDQIGDRQRERANANYKRKRVEEVNRVNSVTPGAIIKVVDMPSVD